MENFTSKLGKAIKETAKVALVGGALYAGCKEIAYQDMEDGYQDSVSYMENHEIPKAEEEDRIMGTNKAEELRANLRHAKAVDDCKRTSIIDILTHSINEECIKKLDQEEAQEQAQKKSQKKSY